MLEFDSNAVVRSGAASMLGACLAAALLVAGCGQKGPLTLAKPAPQSTVSAPAAPASAAAKP
jgi:predicted small lipoprotein YifL